MRKEYKLMKLFQVDQCFQMNYVWYWSVLRDLMLRDRKLRFKAERLPVPKRLPALPLHLAYARILIVMDQPWGRD